MPKIVAFILLGGLVTVGITAVQLDVVRTQQQVNFVHVSVLTESQANYGIDENIISIPAVSPDIIEDKVNDSQVTSAVPVIVYTTLPIRDISSPGQKKENSGTAEKSAKDKTKDKGNTGSNNGNNGNSETKDDNGNADNGNSGSNENSNGTGGSNGNTWPGGKNNNKENKSDRSDGQGQKADKAK